MSASYPPAGSPVQSAILNLRPLSIGEILDRSFSICFKHLLPFAAIVLVVVGPQLLLSYLGFRDVMSMFGNQFATLQGVASGASAPDPTRVLQAYAAGIPYFIALFVLAIVLVPLSNAAIVSGVSRAYLGLPVRFADCYRDAARRWPVLIGLILLWFFSVLAAYFASALAFVFLFLGLGAMVQFLGTVGTIVAVLIGITVAIGLILIVLELYLAAAYSFVAAVLEGLSVGAAFSSGFARVFGEGQVWRSLGISAAAFGIILGFEIVGSVVGGLTIAFTKSFALDFAFSALVTAFTYPFLFAVVAVSYYDVRIRREGFDLQMLAAQLGAPPPPSASGS